jgi:hypothetical protein
MQVIVKMINNNYTGHKQTSDRIKLTVFVTMDKTPAIYFTRRNRLPDSLLKSNGQNIYPICI